MSLIIDQLILHSLEQEHTQVNRLLDLLRLNLDSLDKQPTARSIRNIHNILNSIEHKIAGPHGHKEKIIFRAVRNIDCPPSLPWGNLENEHQQIEAIIRKAAVLLGKPNEYGDHDWLEALNTVITVTRNHIQIEEEIWFPAARLYLAESDWENIMETIRASLEDIYAAAGKRATNSNTSHE